MCIKVPDERRQQSDDLAHNVQEHNNNFGYYDFTRYLGNESSIGYSSCSFVGFDPPGQGKAEQTAKTDNTSCNLYSFNLDSPAVGNQYSFFVEPNQSINDCHFAAMEHEEIFLGFDSGCPETQSSQDAATTDSSWHDAGRENSQLQMDGHAEEEEEVYDFLHIFSPEFAILDGQSAVEKKDRHDQTTRKNKKKGDQKEETKKMNEASTKNHNNNEKKKKKKNKERRSQRHLEIPKKDNPSSASSAAQPPPPPAADTSKLSKRYLKVEQRKAKREEFKARQRAAAAVL